MDQFDGQRWQAEQQQQAEQQRREQEERLRLEREEGFQRQQDAQRALERQAALQRERELEALAALNREVPASQASWWQRLFGARNGSPGPRPPGARRRR